MAAFTLRSRFWSVAAVLLALALVPATAEAAGKRHALLVGVCKYDHFSRLEHTENDVIELATLLKASGYQGKLLTTAAREEALRPTRANILARLGEVLDSCGPEDTILVAFAGHGIQYEKDADGYFCPSDGKPDDPKTLVSFQEVYRRMNGSKASAKLMLVDACRNDPSRSREAKKESRARGGLNGDSAPPPPKGVAVLFSCSKGQVSFENDRIKHGVFFHFVLEGMRGKASASDGEVSWDSLTTYVRKQVSRQVSKIVGEDARQQPTLTVTELDSTPILVAAQMSFLARGKECLERKDHDEGIELLRKAAQLKPDDKEVRAWLASGLGERGRIRIEKGENNLALSDCDEALRLDSSLAWVRYYRGWIYLEKASYDLAIADYSEYLRVVPNDAIAHYNRAMAHKNKGSYDRAIEGCTEALRINPRYANAYFVRAWASNEKRAYGQAIADYTEYLRLNPTDSIAHYNRAVAYQRNGDSERAIAGYTEAIRLNPRYADAYYNRALIAFDKGAYDQAIADYSEYIRLEPRVAVTYYNRSLAYEKRGDKKRAADDMATYRKLGGT